MVQNLLRVATATHHSLQDRIVRPFVDNFGIDLTKEENSSI